MFGLEEKLTACDHYLLLCFGWRVPLIGCDILLGFILYECHITHLFWGFYFLHILFYYLHLLILKYSNAVLASFKFV